MTREADSVKMSPDRLSAPQSHAATRWPRNSAAGHSRIAGTAAAAAISTANGMRDMSVTW